jgi:hypothetical protein
MRLSPYSKKVILEGIRILNNLITPIDRAFRPKTLLEYPTLFIVGAPRARTTLTYQIVTQAFDVAYFSALMGYAPGLFNVQHRLLKPLLAKARPVYTSSYGHTPGFLAPSEHPGFWRQWFDLTGNIEQFLTPDTSCFDRYQPMREALMSVSTIMEKPIVVKCLYLNFLSALLAEVLPTSRFLVVNRDPILTIQSIIVARERRGGSKSWWSMIIPGYQKLLFEPLWKQATAQAFFADFYLAKLLRQHAGDRFKAISYIDLCSSPLDVVRSLRFWLEPLGYRLRNQAHIPERFSASSEVKLDGNTITLIRRYLADLTEEYGACSSLYRRES